MPKIIGSTGGLKPINIVDADTGEFSEARYQQDIKNLIKLIQQESNKILQSQSEVNKIKQGIKELEEDDRNPKQASVLMERLGYRLDYSLLPRDTKAKSRIDRLYRANLGTSIRSYIDNPNPKKQLPRANTSINLGAVDSQMMELSHITKENKLILKWKCWENEYILEFKIPSHYQSKIITKWCAPIIYKKNSAYVFGFSYEQETQQRKYPSKNRHKAGVDFGRVKAYHAAILNNNEGIVAEYKPSGRLKLKSEKLHRLNNEVKHIVEKRNQHRALGNTERANLLTIELKRTKSKRTALNNSIAREGGAELAEKLNKHKVETVNVENLKWAHGKKYGSRWNHSKQQSYFEHSVKQKGMRTKRVNPKDSSQHCWKCDTKLIHAPKKRSVWCGKCKTNLDRDFNASLFICSDRNNQREAMIEKLRKFLFNKVVPDTIMRSIGVSCSPLGQASGYPKKTNSKVQASLVTA